MPKPPQESLLDLLVEHAYHYDPAGFELASGKTSREYLDCKRALSHGDALRAAAAMVLDRLHPDVVAIGGLTMGADPLAFAASYASVDSRPVRWFSVRKDVKVHGRRRLVEGFTQHGDLVCVLDDVVTSGQSTVQAIEKCRAHGLDVRQVIVLVDREDGGLESIRESLGCDAVHALFSKSEIANEWDRRHSRNISTATA